MSTAEVMQGLLTKSTKKWKKQKRAEVRAASAESRRDRMWSYRISIKDLAYRVMKEAYLKASSGGTLPAHARQIMYAARGPIQEETGESLSDQYFCQTLLPDYMAENETSHWDVVFDARGHLREPHTDTTIKLGTLGVRKYLRDVGAPEMEPLEITSPKFKTHGPSGRYGAILFIEKEGFMPLFEHVKLAERYDIALMSTKGLSNTASRHLVDSLCGRYRIPLFVLHDFDKAGFSIVGTLQRATRRYSFRNQIQVVDLGLRLEDVEASGLEDEAVYYRMQSWALRANLRKNGATAEEIEVLEDRRVELNAFASGDLVEWVESKLEENGVEKVIPEDEDLERAYRSELEAAHLRQHTEELIKEAREHAEAAEVPKDLSDRVTEQLADAPAMSWDEAVSAIVVADARGGEDSAGG